MWYYWNIYTLFLVLFYMSEGNIFYFSLLYNYLKIVVIKINLQNKLIKYRLNYRQ